MNSSDVAEMELSVRRTGRRGARDASPLAADFLPASKPDGSDGGSQRPAAVPRVPGFIRLLHVPESRTNTLRINHTIAAHGGSLFLYGGRLGTSAVAPYFPGVFTFVQKRLEWVEVPTGAQGYPAALGSGPGRRGDHSAVVADGKMFVYGGRRGAQVLGDLHVLDIAAKKWIYTPQEPAVGPGPVFGHASAASAAGSPCRRVYVAGGLFLEERSAAVFSWDVRFGYWRGHDGPVGVDPNQLRYCAMQCHGAGLLVHGWRADWNVYRMDEATEAWSEISVIPPVPYSQIPAPDADSAGEGGAPGATDTLSRRAPAAPLIPASPPPVAVPQWHIAGAAYLAAPGLWCFLCSVVAPGPTAARERQFYILALHVPGLRWIRLPIANVGLVSTRGRDTTLFAALGAGGTSEFERKCCLAANPGGDALLLMGGVGEADYVFHRLLPVFQPPPAGHPLADRRPFEHPAVAGAAAAAAAAAPQGTGGLTDARRRRTTRGAGRTAEAGDDGPAGGGVSIVVALPATAVAAAPASSGVAGAGAQATAGVSVGGGQFQDKSGCPVLIAGTAASAQWVEWHHRRLCKWLSRSQRKLQSVPGQGSGPRRPGTTGRPGSTGAQPWRRAGGRGTAAAGAGRPVDGLALVADQISDEFVDDGETAGHSAAAPGAFGELPPLCDAKVGMLDIRALALTPGQRRSRRCLTRLRWALLRGYVVSGQAAVAEPRIPCPPALLQPAPAQRDPLGPPLGLSPSPSRCTTPTMSAFAPAAHITPVAPLPAVALEPAAGGEALPVFPHALGAARDVSSLSAAAASLPFASRRTSVAASTTSLSGPCRPPQFPAVALAAAAAGAASPRRAQQLIATHDAGRRTFGSAGVPVAGHGSGGAWVALTARLAEAASGPVVPHPPRAARPTMKGLLGGESPRRATSAAGRFRVVPTALSTFQPGT